jgi:hypothetical protein
MAERSSSSAWAAALWLPDESDLGAASWLAQWQRFSGRVEDYEDFKNQWLKMKKTGIGDQKLLTGLWEHCLPPDLSRRPGRFLGVTEVWEWLEHLYAYNDLCNIVDEEYYGCPKVCSPAGWYKDFLILKTEIFELYGTETLKMAVVERILEKLPKTERKLWSQFDEIQTAFIEDWPWKFIRFMTHREINLRSKVVSARTMNQKQDWRYLSEASRPAPPTLAVAATTVTSWLAGQPGESAGSSPSPCYREGDYMSGTDADCC